MDFSANTLSIETTDHVATLWLDRPDKLNAISFDMWGDFIRAMEAIAANEDIRAVVVAGQLNIETVLNPQWEGLK